MKSGVILIAAALVLAVATSFSAAAGVDGPRMPGLIGAQYGDEDFSDVQSLSRLESLERTFSKDDGYGRQWSARWEGFIVGPVDGNVQFAVETDQTAQIEIGGKVVVDSEKAKSGSMNMEKGKAYPVVVTYVKEGSSYDSRLSVQWSWGGRVKVVIGGASLFHTGEQEQQWQNKVRESGGDDDDDDDNGLDILSGDSLPLESARPTPAHRVDLAAAKIVVLNPASKIEANAADMLRDEIEKRTRIGLEVVSRMPGRGAAAIVLGVGAAVTKEFALPAGMAIPAKADGYALWVDSSRGGGPKICLAGHDERAVLYAVGRLLRELEMARDTVGLDGDLRVATAPRYALRGNQVGYRPKTNAYDGWSIDIWEQYFRDMIVFGTNAVEFVPPESDDEDDSPLFPKPKLEMMVAMSQLADDYGLDVWIWYPVVDDDDLDDRAISKALKAREEVFRRLPRIDAIFVPGGDPGEVYPDQLFALMERLKKVLNKYHPNAQMWVSPQGFDFDGDAPGYLKAFYEQMAKQPAWLDGVVFGPQVADNLKVLREKLPAQYPIRRYPDITHCLDAQYRVPDWDPAFHVTLYREPINPRPRAYAKIFRDWDQYTCGFITYSEGVNDDVNKFIWASLGWDPEMDVEEILRQYSRYFISGRYEERFAEGLLWLEKNWDGPLLSNVAVYETLRMFQAMERHATPQEKLDWRFQLALYRAYYDAYTRRRLIYETELEEKAMEVLLMADELGSLRALDKAEAILNEADTHKVGTAWRARTFELAEALFQSIRMQLSVDRYDARSVRRGGNLDLIDVPLNNSRQLKKLFGKIRGLGSEDERVSAIGRITAQRYKLKMEHDRNVILEGIN